MHPLISINTLILFLSKIIVVKNMIHCLNKNSVIVLQNLNHSFEFEEVHCSCVITSMVIEVLIGEDSLIHMTIDLRMVQLVSYSVSIIIIIDSYLNDSL